MDLGAQSVYKQIWKERVELAVPTYHDREQTDALSATTLTCIRDNGRSGCRPTYLGGNPHLLSTFNGSTMQDLPKPCRCDLANT
eukprot:624208-Pelagomonas_calceolata.AAC.2